MLRIVRVLSLSTIVMSILSACAVEPTGGDGESVITTCNAAGSDGAGC